MSSSYRDGGSASLWAVTVAAVLLSTTLGVLAWSSALVARQRAQNAADLAALAAAQAEQTGVAGPPGPAGRPGDACSAAHRVVLASAARLVGCSVHAGSEVTVTVEVPLPLRHGLPPARARARAGPT